MHIVHYLPTYLVVHAIWPHTYLATCLMNHTPTLVITVYMNPILAMQASSSTNLYESCSNLKSTGGGYMMERTKLPLAVENPVRITTASTRSLPKYRVWITCVPQKRMWRPCSLASNGMSEFGNGVLVTGTLSPAKYGHSLQTGSMMTI